MSDSRDPNFYKYIYYISVPSVHCTHHPIDHFAMFGISLAGAPSRGRHFSLASYMIHDRCDVLQSEMFFFGLRKRMLWFAESAHITACGCNIHKNRATSSYLYMCVRCVNIMSSVHLYKYPYMLILIEKVVTVNSFQRLLNSGDLRFNWPLNWKPLIRRKGNCDQCVACS